MSSVVEDLYTSGSYALANPDWHAGESPWKAQAILQILRRNDLRPESVIDIGCGTGVVLTILRESLPPATRLVGYDIASQAIDIARTQQSDNLRFETGWPPKGERYDLALVIDVIEHVENPAAWLRQIRGIAKNTVFHIPLDLTLHRVLRPQALPDIRRRYGHLHFFTPELALLSLADAGFEIVDWSYTQEFRLGAPDRVRTMVLNWARRAFFVLSPALEVRVMGGCRLLVLAR